MSTEQSPVTLRGIVVDTTNARAAAEFYRQLLGFPYRPDSEAPPEGQDDPEGRNWLVLQNPVGGPHLAFQQVESVPASTWPRTERPQQLHLDLMLADPAALAQHHERALALGARVLEGRFDDPEEPLYVYADLDGHPFCMFSPPG
jgi:catechol 2,3-dioxygenase-like lactoylglutathione lyase family enzyme